MSKRVLKIAGLLIALALGVGVGAVIGGGAVYAMTRANKATPLQVSREQPDDPELGIVVASVVPDGPAAEAGLVRGDILLEVDGKAVNDLAALVRVLKEYEPGDEVELTVLHGDDERTLTATLSDRDGKPYLGLVPCAALPSPEKMVVARVAEPGAMIVEVVPDSPADLAGLQAGDVIVAVDGRELEPEDEHDLADVIAAYEPGDMVTLEVRRPGEKSRDVTVKLGEHPDNESMAYLGVHYRSFPRFHRLDIEPLPFGWPPFPDEFPHFIPEGEVKQGAIIRRVVEDSPAAAADLRKGDVITAIEGEPVESPQDLTDAVAAHEPGDRMTLTVFRPGEDEEEGREVAVTLAEHPEKKGVAYLGVVIGGFFRVRRFDGKWPHEGERFELDFDLEVPLDELDFDFELPPDEMPFEFDVEPYHFEFHDLPAPFGDDEVHCCGGSV